jgi:hypothetical protein
MTEYQYYEFLALHQSLTQKQCAGSEEEPGEPAPFGMKEVNRRLAALGREPA